LICDAYCHTHTYIYIYVTGKKTNTLITLKIKKTGTLGRRG
jgi:hypothetical protein